MHLVKHQRKNQPVLEARHASLTPQLDVHSHRNPALLPHPQQLHQLHHLLLHGNKVIIMKSRWLIREVLGSAEYFF